MLSRHSTALASHCSPSLGGRSSHYLTGDMLRDSQDCIGPSGQPYPSKYIADMIRRQTGKTGRTGRTLGDMTSTMGNLNIAQTTSHKPCSPQTRWRLRGRCWRPTRCPWAARG